MSSNPYSALNALAGQSLVGLAGQAALGNTIHTGALGAIQNIYPDAVPAPNTRLLRVIMEDGKAYGVIVDGGVNHNDTLPALPLEQAEATVKMMHDIAEQERQERQEAERRKLEEHRKQMEAYNQQQAQQKMLADDAIRDAIKKHKTTELLKKEWFGTLATPDEYEAKQKRSVARRIKDALTHNKLLQEKSK